MRPANSSHFERGWMKAVWYCTVLLYTATSLGTKMKCRAWHTQHLFLTTMRVEYRMFSQQVIRLHITYLGLLNRFVEVMLFKLFIHPSVNYIHICWAEFATGLKSTGFGYQLFNCNCDGKWSHNYHIFKSHTCMVTTTAALLVCHRWNCLFFFCSGQPFDISKLHIKMKPLLSTCSAANHRQTQSVAGEQSGGFSS